MLSNYLIAAAGLADWVPPNLPPVNSTAWSLENPTWDGANAFPRLNLDTFGVTNAGAHAWNADGTKLFVVQRKTSINNTDLVREFIFEYPYALGTVSQGVSFDTGSTFLYGICFAANGTRMYLTRSRAYSTVRENQILQYNLSTSYDLTTAVLARQFDTMSPTNTVEIQSLSGIRVRPDGTKFYLVPQNFDNGPYSAVLQYNAPTPYEATELTWDGRDNWFRLRLGQAPFNILDYGKDVNISADGLRLYVLSSTQAILFNLAQPNALGQVNSWSQFNLTTQTNNAEDFVVSPDGTRMFIIDSGTRRIYQYNIIVPTDIATAYYSGASLDVGNTNSYAETSPSAVTASLDGRYLYFMGKTTDIVYQLEMSNNWELDTAQFLGAESYYKQYISSTYVEGVAFSDDGWHYYTVDRYRVLKQFNCASQFQLWGATLVYTTTLAYSTPREIRFSDSGHRMYILFASNGRIYQYNLSVPWEVSTASLTGNSFNVGAIDSEPESFDIGNYGYYLYVHGRNRGRITQIYLPAPWEIGYGINTGKTKYVGARRSIQVKTNRIYVFTGTIATEYGMATSWEINSSQTYSRSGAITGVPGFQSLYSGFITSNGAYAFAGSYNGNLYKFRLSSAYNISTLQSPSSGAVGLFSYSSTSDSTSITFSSDGRFFFIINQGTTCYTYTFRCNTPWQVHTAVYLNFSSYSCIGGMTFSNDGYKIFYALNNEIRMRVASSGWAISSASAFPTNTVGTGFRRLGSNALDIELNPQGTRFFSMNNASSNYIYQYPASIPYDPGSISTSTYQNRMIPDAKGITLPTARRLYQNSAVTLQQGALTADYEIAGIAAVSTTSGFGYFRLSGARFPRFSPDGTKLFTTSSVMTLRQYTINSAWDISTASTSYSNYLYSSTRNSDAFTINSDGTKFFYMYSTTIYELNFGSAYSNVGSSFVRSKTLSHSANSIAFSLDGTKLFLLGYGNTYDFAIHTYLLSTGFNVSTAVYSSTDYISRGGTPSGSFPVDMIWRTDGKKLIIASERLSKVYINEYTNVLSWIPSTANWIRTYEQYNASHNNTSCLGIDIRPDGQKMYVIGTNNVIYQYTLYIPT